MLFSYTVGLTMSQKRKEYWCGYLFRLIAASPVVNLTPGVSVRVTSDSYAFTAAQIKGQSPVMVICNHRSYADPFVLAAALLPLETKYARGADAPGTSRGAAAAVRRGRFVETSRGAAAAATRTCRGESWLRRGHFVETNRGDAAAVRRGHAVERNRGAAAAVRRGHSVKTSRGRATWTFRGA